MGRSGIGPDAVYAVSSRFPYFGVFGDLSDVVVPSLRGASDDVVAAYAYQDTNGRFLQSLALPRAGQGPCAKSPFPLVMAYMCEWGGGTQAAHAVFHLGQLKNRSFRNFFLMS